MCRILFPRRLFVRIKCNSVRRFPVRCCVKEKRFAHLLCCAEEAACIAGLHSRVLRTSMPFRFARALQIHSRQAYRSQLLSTFLCHLDNLEPSLVAVSFKILLVHSFNVVPLFVVQLWVKNLCQAPAISAGHGRTYLQRHSMFADCDALLPVNGFDHNSTSTPSIVSFCFHPSTVASLSISQYS